MLSRKPQIETHKKSAEGKLAVRLELLKTKGMDAKQIEKDSIIKQLKAKIRKAKHQMGLNKAGGGDEYSPHPVIK
jgi:hypothetical protein